LPSQQPLQPQQHPQQQPLLAPGQRVVIEGLRTRPELNGRHGILGAFDATAGRWAVAVAGASKVGAPLAVKAENLQPVEEDEEDEEGEADDGDDAGSYYTASPQTSSPEHRCGFV
jgi:hypothetical protein